MAKANRALAAPPTNTLSRTKPCPVQEIMRRVNELRNAGEQGALGAACDL